MHNEVPLLQKTYDFYKKYYQFLDHFPKKAKFVLAIKIEQTALDLLQDLANAKWASKDTKILLLKSASKHIDLLKLLFRLCWELKIINKDSYFSFEKDILEMGRMTGGWIKKPNASQNEASE
jgi:four helix bundle protein